ncbi:MAG: hypothetical protein PHF86_09635 [Candidatus Nanoarchaeia archaeon]|nr:hypothetical protein [Candidatus Nanoarchaeia archaeon]
MRLSAKMLENVINVNSWQYTNQAYVSEGQINEVYIQLVDLAKNTQISGRVGEIPEYPLRYISQATIFSVDAIFESIDDSKEFTITGTKPFADDKSIFKFTLTASQIPKSGNLKLTLTEDGVTRTFIIKNSISVQLLNIGDC